MSAEAIGVNQLVHSKSKALAQLTIFGAIFAASGFIFFFNWQIAVVFFFIGTAFHLTVSLKQSRRKSLWVLLYLMALAFAAGAILFYQLAWNWWATTRADLFIAFITGGTLAVVVFVLIPYTIGWVKTAWLLYKWY